MRENQVRTSGGYPQAERLARRSGLRVERYAPGVFRVTDPDTRQSSYVEVQAVYGGQDMDLTCTCNTGDKLCVHVVSVILAGIVA